MDFDVKWIGRDSPISLAPRSPDLAPLDFFLWGFVKTKVYTSNIDDLKNI